MKNPLPVIGVVVIVIVFLLFGETIVNFVSDILVKHLPEWVPIALAAGLPVVLAIFLVKAVRAP